MTTAPLSTHTWHILGAGAIGTLWACHLTLNQNPVRLIVRNQQRLDSYIDPIKISGKTPNSTLTLAGELADCNAPVKHLLVTTKSYDTLTAVRQIAHRLSADSTIVLLQNGMGQQRQVTELVPESAIYAATTTEGAFKQHDKQLIHAGNGESWIGPINLTARNNGSEGVGGLLQLALKTGYDANIEQRLWQKLAINAAINGLTAKHGCQNGELASNPQYSHEMEQLCLEIETVAEALNQPLFEQPLIAQARQVAKATASNYSSMLQDVRSQRATEIDFINGYLNQQAERLGLDIPYNQALIQTIHSLSHESISS